jgi:predicted small secreted protein
MKTIKRSLGTVALAATIILTLSCKDATKNEASATTSNEMHQERMDGSKDMAMNNTQDATAEAVLKDYFNLKDALVGDNNAKAKTLGGELAKSLSSFDMSVYSESEQKKLVNIIKEAKEHAAHISGSDIKHQREHFKTLTKEITDLVAITGTANVLYEQYCPMYDGGSTWLSTKKEVRNPYYGNSMLKCGRVQKKIN